MSSYVWYASYGSNLADHRFRHYIEGGAPTDGLRAHPGARSQASVTGNGWLWCDHELYFARYSKGWGGAVAFVDPAAGSGRSLLRTRRVLRGQFEDVMAQENGMAPGDLALDHVPDVGDSYVMCDRWYGTLLCVGTKSSSNGEVEPILTFTSAELSTPGRPSASYLGTILAGLSVRDSSFDSLGYVGALSGVAGLWNEHDLAQLAALEIGPVK